MFSPEFYPTPPEEIENVFGFINVAGKVVFEPSAGSGNIVDYCLSSGANEVIACETHEQLRSILNTKCKVIAGDFFTVKAENVSHVDVILGNPPFSNDYKHILHAWEIAPPGCEIAMLCNSETLKKTFPNERRLVNDLIEQHGDSKLLGEIFSNAARKTNVSVGLVYLKKPGEKTEQEFNGFFMDDEHQELQGNGIIKYDFIRDLVQRYVNAVRIYDEQLAAAVKMQSVIGGYFSSQYCMSISKDGVIKSRDDFKKDIQKAGWNFIFQKLNLEKFCTKGVRQDINAFIEKQTQVPFTMRNIYRMLEIIIGTASQRMDKALLEVFDKLTKYTHENRYNLPGWKTNSHYLLNKRFIFPYCIEVGFRGNVSPRSNGNFEDIQDMMKALCYLTGDNFNNFISLETLLRYRYALRDAKGNYLRCKDGYSLAERDFDIIQRKQKEYYGSEIVTHDVAFGQWFDWHYFRVRCYKKGTMHLEFKDARLWELYNRRIAEIKGYPLFESKY